MPRQLLLDFHGEPAYRSVIKIRRESRALELFVTRDLSLLSYDIPLIFNLYFDLLGDGRRFDRRSRRG